MDKSSSVRHALVYKFLTFNVFGLALLGALFQNGWIEKLYNGDLYHVLKVMVVIFLVGMTIVANRVFKLNAWLNQVADDPIVPTTPLDAIKLRLTVPVKTAMTLASTLLMAGLAGTVLGPIYATDAIDQSAISDPSAVGPMIAGLFHGISVKFLSSLTGICLSMWLVLSTLLVSQANVELVARLIEAEHG